MQLRFLVGSRVVATVIAVVAAFVTAGLTIALQKVITSFAGYLSILRGKVFTVGDRITMGGVRGDVVALSYLRTTVMEMGQPPHADSDEPGRQYTGRIVTITNDKVFDTPIYNYTREFPWEEIHLPIHYGADWQRAESLLLDAARTATAEMLPAASDACNALLTTYVALEPPRLEPQVYLRLTDNWIELTLRFLTRERGVRDVKNQIFRRILQEMTAAGIDVASTTFAIVRVPPISLSGSR